MDPNKLEPKIGLALGGGGARGLAHAGVLKVLEAEGFRPACITGSSMGGLIAALYAAGMSAAKIEAEVLHYSRLAEMVKLVDFSRPRRGLIEGQRLRETMCSLLGAETTFDQLPVPLALTAVDLCSGQEVLLNEGNLVQAVLATLAVPSLFQPVMMGPFQLVDGGIINNVPVDVARGMGADMVIAVDVTPYLPEEPSQDAQDDGLLPPMFPSLAKDFYMAELIMVAALTRNRLRESHPELVIAPVIPKGISIFWGFTRAAEAIQSGEEAARAAIPDIRRLVQQWQSEA